MQKCLVVSIENSMYHSQFSIFIIKGLAVMRFSRHVLEVSCIPELFILMCWAYAMKRAWKQIMTLHSQSLLSPPWDSVSSWRSSSRLYKFLTFMWEWMWGWKSEDLTPGHGITSLNLLHQWNESWTKDGFLEDICIYASTFLWGEFFTVGRPGNSQG